MVSTSFWMRPRSTCPEKKSLAAGGSAAKARRGHEGGDDAEDDALHGYLPRYGPEGAFEPCTFWWQFLQECSIARLLTFGPVRALTPS